MHRSLAAITIALALLNLGNSGLVGEPKALEWKSEEKFPVDESLRARVSFWVEIYSKYNSWQSLVHDKLYPQIIYGVAESDNPEKRAAAYKTQAIQKEAQRILRKLHEHRAAIAEKKFTLTAEEQRIYDLFANIPGDDKFLAAADAKRFRTQGGLKDQLLKALRLSGRYLPRMEKVFSREGLPEQIAYLPFVESSFNREAVSKVGASGIWQIMPTTGREYLRVDAVVDERNDPMRAAEAAAHLMHDNFETLRSWPLAITAYNHGKLGMARAVKQLGTQDLSQIIAKYESPSFGFASANFYASFLAAKHVAEHHEYYLGKVEKDRLLEFDEFVVTDFVGADVLSQYIKVPLADLRELNPALSEEVWNGKSLVPVGYTLRVPLAARDSFLERYESIPAELKFAEQKKPLDESKGLAAALKKAEIPN